LATGISSSPADLEELSRQALRSALTPVRRRSFLRNYLLMLWPSSERLLLELARRLGGEVCAPGTPVTLLSASIRAGVRNFDRRRDRNGYDPRTWAGNIYVHFWQGVMEAAAAVMGCQGHTVCGVWEPARRPFIDWRLEHPGEIVWKWIPVLRPTTEAERLYRLILRDGPQTRVVRALLQVLPDG